jgi:hypothetical protein
MNGYAGSILRLNLADAETSTIDTKDYEPWVGGHGIGSAVFWDLAEDKTISGFDAGNVVTIMTSPLSGTLAPGASGRTEVQGIGVQSYPIGWFTRSNFGGRFGAMLKFAGWESRSPGLGRHQKRRCRDQRRPPPVGFGYMADPGRNMARGHGGRRTGRVDAAGPEQ